MKHPVYLIAAADLDNGIGKNGLLPWRLKKDLAFFQHTTEHTDDPLKLNMVIMGRVTWASIPENHRPLPGRVNVVLSNNGELKIQGAEVFTSLEAAVNSADASIEKIFVIGGARVFSEAVSHEKIDGIYLTRIDSHYDCDAFFPEIPKAFKKTTSLGSEEEDGVSFEFLLYEKA